MDPKAGINKSKEKLQAALKIIGVEAGIVSVVIVVIVLILNYFGVIPLSKVSFFSFLPSQDDQEEAGEEIVQNNQAQVALPEIPQATPSVSLIFPCPISGNNCREGGQPIFDINTDLAGFAYRNITPDTPIISMNEGVVESVSDSGDENAIVIRTEAGIEARYNFYGQSNVENGQDVKQGDIIGIIDNRFVVTPYSTEQFSIYVSVRNAETGQIVPLIPDKERGLRLLGEQN